MPPDSVKALYATADRIGSGTGGGTVTYHELRAWRSLHNEAPVVDRVYFPEVEVIDQSYLEQFNRAHDPFSDDYFAAEKVRKLDIVRAHFYSGTFTQTVAWLKSRGAKVSYTVPAHDRRVTVDEFRRLGLEYPYAHISQDSLWRIFSGGYLEADVVIAPSEASAHFLREEGCSNVVIIPHGCDIPEKVAPFPQVFHVGYLGQVGPDKGLGYLLKAWELLNYRDSILYLAGPGTETLAPFIQRSVSRGNFRVLGWVDSPSVLYNQVSVYCQPSVCESFGIEVLEALAHGRPVIVSEGAGASELVEEGKTGFVVPIRDPQAIAERIDFFRQNPTKVSEMGQRGRESIRAYTWDKIEERYQELWPSIGFPSGATTG